MIAGVDVRWLIEHQRLAPYEYYAPTLVEADGLRTLAGDYVATDLERLMMGRAIYGDVIATYKRLAEGEQEILGHADASTTLNFYVKSDLSQMQAATNKLAAAFGL